MSSVMLFILLFSGLSTLSYTLSDLRCKNGWSQFGSRCFMVVTTVTNWNSAEQTCVDMGGHLASVHSIDEYTFIQSLVFGATSSAVVAWLGATNAVQGNIWVWTDGSAFDFSSWNSGEPNNAGSIEHWLSMDTQGGWNDASLGSQFYPVCVKAAIPAKIKAVIQLKIITTDNFLESEQLVQQVKQKLIDSGMPSNFTLRLTNIYKKPTQN